ncbi:hypothetical protein Leryth_001038 [Lithospermum erythrorhizon]|nr:hypothetical protein Leryth_001038 [Lithospermum erythrorhizon]
MCFFIYVCDKEEEELGRKEAQGACPYCGGKVEAVDVQKNSRFCFLHICSTFKRKYFCTTCTRRLILCYS